LPMWGGGKGEGRQNRAGVEAYGEKRRNSVREAVGRTSKRVAVGRIGRIRKAIRGQK